MSAAVGSDFRELLASRSAVAFNVEFTSVNDGNISDPAFQNGAV